MQNEETQEKDTLEPEEVEETTEDVSEDTEDSVDDEPDYDTLKEQLSEAEKKAKTLEAQKLHWKNKATKKEESKKKPDSKSNKEESSDFEERLERQDLRLDGYSPEEVDYLMRNGGKEATKDKFVMAAIERLREQNKAEEAAATSKAQGGGVLKGLTEEQIANMSSKELEEKIQSGKK